MSRMTILTEADLRKVVRLDAEAVNCIEDAFRALDYGADDFDLPIEDEVTQKAGATIDLDLQGLLAIPRAMGYTVEYRHAERALATAEPSTA